MFARWGRFVYRHRWPTLGLSGFLMALSVVGLLTGGQLTGNGGFGGNLPAGLAASLVNREIAGQSTAAGSSMTLLFSSTRLKVTDAAYQSAVEAALATLSGDSRVSAVRTPYNVPPLEQARLISRDGHKALVVVELKDGSAAAQKYVDQLVAEVHPGPLAVVATGNVPINQAFNRRSRTTCSRAEVVALPITLILLVLIFAAVAAALLPLGVGVLAILGGLGGTLVLAHLHGRLAVRDERRHPDRPRRRDRLLAVHRQQVS